MTTSTQMEIQSKELNPCTVELTVRCSPEQVRAGLEKAYRRAAKRVRIPGFRPGSAPKELVQQYVNADQVRRMAAESIIQDTYAQAIKQENLSTHGPPNIEIIKFDAESAECEFKAEVPLRPKVELGDYSGLEAVRPEVEVSDDEVEAHIEDLRRKRATRKAVESRGAQTGDFAVVNIKPEGEEEGRNFMTAVGQTFPQLDQALMGMKPEDSKLVDLTFPNDFDQPDWAGKLLKCSVSLRSLSAPELPELGEEFAKQFKAESVDELRIRVRERLLKAKEVWADEYMNEQLLEELLRVSTVHVPDTIWKNTAGRRLAQIAEEAERDAGTLQSAATQANMTVDELRQRLEEEARLQVKRAFAVKEVFEREGMTLDREIVALEIAQIARELNVAPAAAHDALRRSGNLEEVRFRAMFKQVLALLRERAKISGAAPES